MGKFKMYQIDHPLFCGIILPSLEYLLIEFENDPMYKIFHREILVILFMHRSII